MQLGSHSSADLHFSIYLYSLTSPRTAAFPRSFPMSDATLRISDLRGLFKARLKYPHLTTTTCRVSRSRTFLQSSWRVQRVHKHKVLFEPDARVRGCRLGDCRHARHHPYFFVGHSLAVCALDVSHCGTDGRWDANVRWLGDGGLVGSLPSSEQACESRAASFGEERRGSPPAIADELGSENWQSTEHGTRGRGALI